MYVKAPSHPSEEKAGALIIGQWRGMRKKIALIGRILEMTAVGEEKRYNGRLEALDTKMSRVVASTTVWGRPFQSLMVLGRKDCCWYVVRHRGCVY